MSNLLFWLGIGAAQKGAGSKPIERRHWVASLIVGILGAVLIAVGMFLPVGQPSTMKLSATASGSDRRSAATTVIPTVLERSTVCPFRSQKSR